MKILYFHQHFSTPEGSTGSRSYEMARRLIARGHSVTMICGSYRGGVTGLSMPFQYGRRRGVVNGIDVIEFDLAYANQDGLFKRAIIFLKFVQLSVGLVFTESYDLVFATSTPLTAGIPGIVARWFRRKPFVFEVRDLWPELPKAMGVVTNPIVLAGLSFLEKITYCSAHHLIGLSPGIVEGIRRRGISSNRISMVSNGCDLRIFSTATEPWRPEGVSASDLMAVYTGAHGVANGLNALLDVAAELQLRGRCDIKLVLVGEGKCKAALQARAKNENLNNVIFHVSVNKQRLAGLISAADVGLQLLANVEAFYYGTSPNKFFDYIAAGVAVLINYPGWLAEVISKNQCGYCVSPQNTSAFADALEKAANERDLIKWMGKNAHQLAVREFNRLVLADHFVDCIDAGLAEAS